MDKLKSLFALGVFVTVLPYLGFPMSFKNILISLSGISVLYIYYQLSKEAMVTEEKQHFDNFSENNHSAQEKGGNLPQQ